MYKHFVAVGSRGAAIKQKAEITTENEECISKVHPEGLVITL